jgi:hypothetical protein
MKRASAAMVARPFIPSYRQISFAIFTPSAMKPEKP